MTDGWRITALAFVLGVVSACSDDTGRVIDAAGEASGDIAYLSDRITDDMTDEEMAGVIAEMQAQKAASSECTQGTLMAKMMAVNTFASSMAQDDPRREEYARHFDQVEDEMDAANNEDLSEAEVLQVMCDGYDRLLAKIP